jgi:hypothetical protein
MKLANSHKPLTTWARWFAWHPVETNDDGWRWLEWRERRETASDEFSGTAHEYRAVKP